MSISPTDIKDILAEKDSERANLVCTRHQYTGSRMPPKSTGCKECWMVYYCYDLATTPPSLRKERLDELEHVVRKVADMSVKGTWDFQPDERPDIQFIQDGLNDETGNYREDE